MTAGEHTPFWSRATSGALLLGMGHALVDAAGGFLIHADLASAAGPGQSDILGLVLLYNLIAFCCQAPLGYLADRLGAHRGAAMLGLLAGMIALTVGPRLVMVEVVAAGLGNALFHVGAGALVLMVSGVRAAEAGVFVGPGALGLYGGAGLSGQGMLGRWSLVALLGLWLPLVWVLGRRMARPPEASLVESKPRRLGLLLVSGVGLIGSVYMRSLVGGLVSKSWKNRSAVIPGLLAGAACLGKMAGGFIGDGLGWLLTSLVALGLAAPLVTTLLHWAPAAVVGALLFQVTMPVTLKATHHLFPRHPGFAFGLPSLFLAAGALTLRAVGPLLRGWSVGLGLVALAAIFVAAGLLGLNRLGQPAGPGTEGA